MGANYTDIQFILHSFNAFFMHKNMLMHNEQHLDLLTVVTGFVRFLE